MHDSAMGKVLFIAGLVLAGLGGLLMLGAPLGRLPGDVLYRKGNLIVYLPLGTALLLSFVLTIFLRWWK